MNGSKQKAPATTPSDAAAATPFFARFLEDQHGGGVAQAATLKYPSDRDEIDIHSPALSEGAATNAGPSRMTLKYPSDRDEIDIHAS